MSDFDELPEAKVTSLGAHAKRAHELQSIIDDLTLKLQVASEDLRQIVEIKMPEIMMEIGIEQIKLTTGEKCTMKPFYSASIDKENPFPAFQWLKDHGHDSLIKNKVEASFGKGEEKRVQELMETLAPLGFINTKSVHASTLKAFVKEQVEAGTPPPEELFHLYIGKKVTIK